MTQMEFFENLKECLQGTQSGSAEVRKNAEAEIRRLRDLDPKKFLATLTREIANDSLDSGSRQMACIIFKNFIINRSAKDSKYENYWVNLDTEFREFMKEAIIAQLASPESLVRAQVANVVAAIASIEIPRKEWEELLPNLCQNAEHTDYNIRLASLITLGYICEEVDPSSIVDPLKNRVILALINNMVTNEGQDDKFAACRVATKALSISIPFVSQNFKVQNERDYIMQRIFNACETSGDDEIIVNCLQSLREISTQEYESIQYYFTKICEVTSTASQNPSDQVGGSAFEFWTTIIEDETERKHKNAVCMNYIDNCKESLIQMVLNGLMVVNFEEDEDEDDWGHAVSAGICLQKLACLIKNDVMQAVLSFVDEKIQTSDWKKRYPALIALGSITVGPDKDKFLEVIVQALPLLVGLFSDTNQKVREAISWVMSMICTHHVDVVTSPQAASEIIPRLVQGLKDQPRISNQCCLAIEQLAQEAKKKDEDQKSNCLTPYFKDTLAVLLENAKRTDYHGLGVNLLAASYTSMTTMVQNACEDSKDVVFDLLVPVLQSLEQTLSQSGEAQKQLQDNLCCLLQVCLFQAGHKLDAEYQNKITTLIIQLFSQEGRVTESGLMAYTGLVAGVGENIDISEMGKYIKHALEQNEDDCGRLACGIIDDLATNMGTRLVQYLQDFVPCLLNILKSSEVEQKIKLPALSSLGSLALNQGDDFHRTYLQETLTILSAAASTCVQTHSVSQDDEETLEFLGQLRHEILTQYSTILVSICDTSIEQCKNNFEVYVPSICDFLEQTLRLEKDVNSEFLIQIAQIMTDMALQFHQNQILKSKLHQDYVTQMLTQLNNFGDSDSTEMAMTTFNALNEMKIIT